LSLTNPDNKNYYNGLEKIH